MYRLKAYLNDCPQFVVVILGPALTAWAELDHFAEYVLRRSFRASGRIMKISQCVRRARVSYLSIIWQAPWNRGSGWKGIASAIRSAIRESPEVHAIEFHELTHL